MMFIFFFWTDPESARWNSLDHSRSCWAALQKTSGQTLSGDTVYPSVLSVKPSALVLACAWWVVWRWPPLSKPVGAYCLPERTGACSFVSTSCLGTEESMFSRKHGRVGGRFRFSSTSLHIYLLILRWAVTAQFGLKLKLTMQGSWSSRSQQLSCLSLQMLGLQAWCFVVFSMLLFDWLAGFTMLEVRPRAC